MVESLPTRLHTVKLGVAPDMFVAHDYLEVLIVKGGDRYSGSAGASEMAWFGRRLGR